MTEPDPEHIDVRIGYDNKLDSTWLLVRFKHHQHKSAMWETVTYLPGE